MFELKQICSAIFASLALAVAMALAAPTNSAPSPDQIRDRWLAARCKQYDPTYSDNTLMEVNNTASDLRHKADIHARTLEDKNGGCKIDNAIYPMSSNRVNRSLMNNETLQLQAFREETLRVTRSYYTLIIDRAVNLRKIEDAFRSSNDSPCFSETLFADIKKDIDNVLCALNETAYQIKDEMDPSDSRRNDPVYDESQLPHSIVNTGSRTHLEKSTQLMLRELELLARETQNDYTFLRATSAKNNLSYA